MTLTYTVESLVTIVLRGTKLGLDPVSLGVRDSFRSQLVYESRPT